MLMTLTRESYTDEQVTTATRLHVDNLRKLITWGAVKPLQAGGGRGRVRMWSTRQALRISVTAQFVEAGFSLQMAHTLTYCLPLDDLLYVYDPEVLALFIAKKPELYEEDLLSVLTGRAEIGSRFTERYLGSRTLVVDGRYLYSDALGDCPCLMAVIDPVRQRAFPTASPSQFLYGAGMVEDLDLPRVADAVHIDRSSLLIDDQYFVRRKKWKPLPEAILPKGIEGQLVGLDKIVCRTLLVINLALGLATCVRTLRGVPTNYQPRELPYDN